MMALKLSQTLNCLSNLSSNHNFNIFFTFMFTWKSLKTSMQNFKRLVLHSYV